MDLAAVGGSLIGLAAIVLGQWLEGGSLSQLAQLTAAIIVVLGTAGATFLAFPLEELKRAVAYVPLVYLKLELDFRPVIEEIVELAGVARKEGVLALEGVRQQIRDPLFRKSIKFVIDGHEPGPVRELLEGQIDLEREDDESAARVFESAGGYAPTIGILGAVLGLIHVMSMLNEPAKIGEGIAVAFVATVYGVALANLILLPWGGKLKRVARARALRKELILQGVLGIQEGLNPNFLKEKLELFLAAELRGLARPAAAAVPGSPGA